MIIYTLILQFTIFCHSLPFDSEGEPNQESIKLYCQNYIDSRLRGNDKKMRKFANQSHGYRSRLSRDKHININVYTIFTLFLHRFRHNLFFNYYPPPKHPHSTRKRNLRKIFWIKLKNVFSFF